MKETEWKEMYEANRAMIISLAFTFHAKAGMDMEDVMSELNISFCKVALRYDERRGTKFSTFLYGCLINQCFKLIESGNAQKNRNLYFWPPEEIVVQIVSGNPEDVCIFKDSLFNNPDEVVRTIGGILSTYRLPKGKKAPGVRGWIEKILKSFGFQQKEIVKGFREFKKIY